MNKIIVGLIFILLSKDALSGIIEIHFDNGWLVETSEDISEQIEPWPEYKITYFGGAKILNTGNILPGTYFNSGSYVEDDISIPDYGIGFFEQNHTIKHDGTYVSSNMLHMLEGNGVGELSDSIVLTNILNEWIGRSFYFDSSYDAVAVNFGETTLTSWNYKTIPEPSSIWLFFFGVIGLILSKTTNKKISLKFIDVHYLHI